MVSLHVVVPEDLKGWLRRQAAAETSEAGTTVSVGEVARRILERARHRRAR